MQNFLNLMFCYNMIPWQINLHWFLLSVYSANAIDHIITNSVTDHKDFKLAIIKTTCQIIFLLSSQLKLMKRPKYQLQNLPTNALIVKRILTNLKILCTTEIGMTLKKLKTPTKHVNTFSISLMTLMTIRSQNQKLKVNSKAIGALGLLKVLQNYQKSNKDFTKNS